MKKAFTLIELLVVIVIIGILAGISISTFKNKQEKAYEAQTKAATTQLETLIRADVASANAANFLTVDPAAVFAVSGLEKPKRGQLSYVSSEKDFLLVASLNNSNEDGLWGSVFSTAMASGGVSPDGKFFLTGSGNAVAAFNGLSAQNKILLAKDPEGNSAVLGADYVFGAIVFENAKAGLRTTAFAVGEGDVSKPCIEDDAIGALCGGGKKLNNSVSLSPVDLVVFNNSPSGRWAGQSYSWPNAKAECDAYEGGGHDNWRLPNLQELQDLGASDLPVFGHPCGDASAWYWSGEHNESTGKSRAYEPFCDGSRFPNGYWLSATGFYFRVVCVR